MKAEILLNKILKLQKGTKCPHCSFILRTKVKQRSDAATSSQPLFLVDTIRATLTEIIVNIVNIVNISHIFLCKFRKFTTKKINIVDVYIVMLHSWYVKNIKVLTQNKPSVALVTPTVINFLFLVKS